MLHAASAQGSGAGRSSACGGGACASWSQRWLQMRLSSGKDVFARLQVRVWVPAGVMRRAQALMVQRDGPGSSGLTVTVRSDFASATVPLQVRGRAALVA